MPTTKLPLWSNPNNSIAILEATDTAAEEYGLGYGASPIKLKRKHIEALLQGKMLAWNDLEYSTFVIFGEAETVRACVKAVVEATRAGPAQP